MNKLAIIGSSDLGQLIAHHAVNDKHYDLVGFYDDFKNEGDKVKGIKVLGKISKIETDYKKGVFDKLLIGIGYKHFDFRKKTFELFQGRIPFGKLVHSSCYVDSSCQLGDGVVLFPGCTLDQNVILNNNVLLNTACVIAHDSKVGPHTFLSPGVVVAGFVSIGECCNIGINSTVIDNIVIGDNIQTGGGCVVINNIDKRGKYVGVPARFLDEK
jgi:sugar O-acyltransferase (sialic acid O-acetyltransferase NeuD family)